MSTRVTPYIVSKYTELTYSLFPNTPTLKFKPLTNEQHIKTWLWAYMQNLKQDSKFRKCYYQYVIDDFVYVTINSSSTDPYSDRHIIFDDDSTEEIYELINEIESFQFPDSNVPGDTFHLKFLNLVSKDRLKIYSMLINCNHLHYTLDELIYNIFPSETYVIHAYDVINNDNGQVDPQIKWVQLLVESTSQEIVFPDFNQIFESDLSSMMETMGFGDTNSDKGFSKMVLTIHELNV